MTKSKFQALMDTKLMSAFKFFPDDTLITHNQEEVVGREIRYKICKYAEILGSETIAKQCNNMQWEMTAFKEFNRLSSALQGNLILHIYFNRVCYVIVVQLTRPGSTKFSIGCQFKPS